MAVKTKIVLKQERLFKGYGMTISVPYQKQQQQNSASRPKKEKEGQITNNNNHDNNSAGMIT